MNTFVATQSRPGTTTARLSQAGSGGFLGFFFALTGALIATSVYNIGDSGLPVFYLAAFLPLLALAFPGAIPSRSITQRQLHIYLSLGTIFLLLSAVTFFQIVADRQPAAGEVSHAISRLSFLGYCAICIYFLRGYVLASCMVWLRRILTLVAMYGIYQVPAKILGLPLVLDWLRNNRSFALYNYDSAGWVSLVRATSVYAEPSQCTVPVLVLMFLNMYSPAPRWSKAFVWMAVSTFGLLTFSRTIWLAAFGLIALRFLMRFPIFENSFHRRKLSLAIMLVVVTLLMPLWAYYGGNYKADISRQERAGSVVIGIDLIEDHPFLGSGWNSYETLLPNYQGSEENVSPEVLFRTIHNMFVSYAEQAGVFGFIFAIFPFFAIMFWSPTPVSLRFGSILSFLIVAELGGDVGYSSLFWLWIAILINWNTYSDNKSALATEPQVLRYAA